MPRDFDTILRDAQVNAKPGSDGTVLQVDGGSASLGPTYVENSVFVLGEQSQIEVQSGAIEFADPDGQCPQLIVDLGRHLPDGPEIDGAEFDLPPRIDIRGGRLVPASPAVGFPEGQSRARVPSRVARRLMYGKAAR
jgi:hypothetical protein